MKREKLFLFMLLLGVSLFHGALYAAAPKGCFNIQELNDFKKLYIDLQNKLNYEGMDAYLDKNNKLQLKAHQKGEPYPGKEFEAAMFAEYQNSLRKIGRLYQSAKYEGDENFKSNKLLVDFMAAIEDKKSDSPDFIKKTDIDQVMKALKDASKQKFGSTDTDKKYVITEQDEYLLRKLLTHAQDRICNLATFNKTGKPLTKGFDVNYLQQVKNAPLNRLLQTLKTAGINKDSKIDLLKSSSLTEKLMNPDLAVDPAVAINSAVASDIEKLSKWVKNIKAKNPKCFDYLKTKGFSNQVQLNIQSCNLGEFLDTISSDNYSNLEAVLHYINANERFLNRPQAKAETALDEVGLEGFISNTFNGLSNRVVCTEIVNSQTGDKKRFVRNLPYNQETNTFDKSSIICTANKKQLSPSECAKQYDLVSDELGRGLELRSKKTNLKNVTISVSKDGANCSDLSLDTEEPTPNKPDTNVPKISCEQIKDKKDGFIYLPDEKLGCKEVKCEDHRPDGFPFVWNKEKKSCVPTQCKKSDEAGISIRIDATTLQCIAKKCEEIEQDGKKLKWDEEKKECVLPDDKKPEESKDDKSCDKMEKKEGFNYEIDEKTKECVEKKCEDYKPDGFPYVWNKEQKKCVPTQCKELNEPGISNILDPKTFECKKTKCEDLPVERGAKKFTWDEKAKKCVTPADGMSDKEKQCIEKQKKWREESGRRGIKFEWDPKKKECIDKKPDPKDDDDDEEGAMGPMEAPIPWKQPPPRFTPLRFQDTRRPYLLPGSP